MAELLVNKKVELELVGLDGNAFALMGAFQREARRQGWERKEIARVLDECQQGDYNHLLGTLLTYTEAPDAGNCDECGAELDYEDCYCEE